MTLYLDSRALLKRYIDEPNSDRFGDIGTVTGARSLDALHLAALQRAGPQGITLVTADTRQAQARRSLGFEVVGS